MPLCDAGFPDLFSGLENVKDTREKGWSTNEYSRETAKAFAKSKPNANICMRMGNGLGGLDIDFDNPVAATEARAEAIERFGRDVPLRATTGDGNRFLLLYRHGNDIRARSKVTFDGFCEEPQVIEIRPTHKEYFVVYGRQPKGEYVWTPRELYEVGFEGLPHLTYQDIYLSLIHI